LYLERRLRSEAVKGMLRSEMIKETRRGRRRRTGKKLGCSPTTLRAKG